MNPRGKAILEIENGMQSESKAAAAARSTAEVADGDSINHLMFCSSSAVDFVANTKFEQVIALCSKCDLTADLQSACASFLSECVASLHVYANSVVIYFTADMRQKIVDFCSEHGLQVLQKDPGHKVKVYLSAASAPTKRSAMQMTKKILSDAGIEPMTQPFEEPCLPTVLSCHFAYCDLLSLSKIVAYPDGLPLNCLVACGLGDFYCRNCLQVNQHFTNRCPSAKCVRCSVCGTEGHNWLECHVDEKDAVCLLCHASGHVTSRCPTTFPKKVLFLDDFIASRSETGKPTKRLAVINPKTLFSCSNPVDYRMYLSRIRATSVLPVAVRHAADGVAAAVDPTPLQASLRDSVNSVFGEFKRVSREEAKEIRNVHKDIEDLRSAVFAALDRHDEMLKQIFNAVVPEEKRSSYADQASQTDAVESAVVAVAPVRLPRSNPKPKRKSSVARSPTEQKLQKQYRWMKPSAPTSATSATTSATTSTITAATSTTMSVDTATAATTTTTTSVASNAAPLGTTASTRTIETSSTSKTAKKGFDHDGEHDHPKPHTMSTKVSHRTKVLTNHEGLPISGPETEEKSVIKTGENVTLSDTEMVSGGAGLRATTAVAAVTEADRKRRRRTIESFKKFARSLPTGSDLKPFPKRVRLRSKTGKDTRTRYDDVNDEVDDDDDDDDIGNEESSDDNMNDHTPDHSHDV
jgi:hypothetical protein